MSVCMQVCMSMCVHMHVYVHDVYIPCLAMCVSEVNPREYVVLATSLVKSSYIKLSCYQQPSVSNPLSQMTRRLQDRPQCSE